MGSSDQTLVITVAMSLSPTCVEYLYRHTVSPNIARRCGYVDSRQETTMYQASEMSSCFSSTLPYLRARSTSPVGQWINPPGPQQRKSCNSSQSLQLYSILLQKSQHRARTNPPSTVLVIRVKAQQCEQKLQVQHAQAIHLPQEYHWEVDGRATQVTISPIA